jgi:hypothetical protein
MRSMVEGACGGGASFESEAPSTTLLRRVVVPLPRFAGQDDYLPACEREIINAWRPRLRVRTDRGTRWDFGWGLA